MRAFMVLRVLVRHVLSIVNPILVREPGVGRSSTPPRGVDLGHVDLLHRHHRVEGALGLGPAGRHRLGERARGDLPGEAPAVLAPAALALLASVADDRVPVAVGFLLVVRRDLEGERLALLEGRTAVEAETRNAQDRELHGEDIAGLASREVAGRLANRGHSAVRKGGGIEACGRLGVLVVPEADRVLRVHGCDLLRHATRRGCARPLPHHWLVRPGARVLHFDANTERSALMKIAGTIHPCLSFDSQADEAARFYTSVFPNSRIVKVTHYTEAGQD